MKTTVALLILFTLLLPNSFAQDYTQWGLPEGAKARLGKGWISGNIAYSPDGASLAVASSIGIWLYDTVIHREVALLTGHTSRVTSVVYSPDGGTLAGGSDDGTVRLWDAVTGQEKATLTGYLGAVYSVSFSPDGLTVASGSGDGTVLLWELTPDASLSVEPSILRATTFGQVKRSALLQNFPNPFNPETWIPYTLAHGASVSIGIYNVRGQLVRQIDLGQQPAGSYLNRETAAYWDGKDQFGEAVSSGVHFYTLKADTFQATRGMVILK